MCKIWGVPYTMAIFPAFNFTPESLFSVLSFFFLILGCLFPLTHCSTRCLLWNVNFSSPFQLSMKLWEEDVGQVGGFIFLSPLISLLHKYLSVCLRLYLFLSWYFYHSLSACLFFWSPLCFPVLYFVSLLYPRTCLSCTNERMTDLGVG